MWMTRVTRDDLGKLKSVGKGFEIEDFFSVDKIKDLGQLKW